MNTELRPYQIEWVGQINEALRAGPKARVVGQLPTGGGKSVAACAVIEGWRAQHPDARIFWVTHRKELVDQSAGVLNAEGIPAIGARSDVWRCGMPAPLGDGVIVTSPVVLRNRNGLAGGGEDDLLVMDEAHHSAAQTWADLLERHTGPALGLTATPWRLSRKEGLDHLYNTLVCGPDVADLIDAGALSRFRLFGPPLSQAITGQDEDKGADGEYREGAIERRTDRAILLDNALDLWQRYGATERQTLIYALTVQHAENIADLWQANGYSADIITAKTPAAERDATMDRYRAGELQVLVNVGIATEGFDIPAIGCVLILRPTASVALYLQMMGRGLRPSPGGEPALLLDLTDNPHRLGRPDDARNWTLAARGSVADEQRAAPTKLCWDGYEEGDPESQPCGAVNAAGAHYCEECGAAFGKECAYCGRFRSWGDWGGADRCQPCVDGLRHASLDYVDPWKTSRAGNMYRRLGGGRVLMLFGWRRQDERPNGALLEGNKVTSRRWLDDFDLTDRAAAQWQVLGYLERSYGIDDRPPEARELLAQAVKAYRADAKPEALGLLQQAEVAHGADRVGERIQRGLALCLE